PGAGARRAVARGAPLLGCVVPPPADEATPPFPDYGWGLRKVREDIEDWHESLRTLYVACTRAQDYLILSAAVSPSFRPSSTWMLTLAERFDLDSRRCLLPGLPAGQSPAGRVTRELTEPGDASASGAADSLAPAEACVGCPAAMPLLRTSQRVFTVEELEASLRPSFAEPGTFAVQFDTEDGSDRNHWPTLRERVEPCSVAASPGERLLRAVLQAWDFRDPQGWRPVLRRAAGELGLPGEAGGRGRGA